MQYTVENAAVIDGYDVRLDVDARMAQRIRRQADPGKISSYFSLLLLLLFIFLLLHCTAGAVHTSTVCASLSTVSGSVLSTCML